MPIPNISASATSGAKSGDAYSSGSQTTGNMTFGGSGSGGAVAGLGGAVLQYWPLLAVAGAIWYFRKKLT